MEEVEHEKKSLGGASAMTSATIAFKAPVDVAHRRQSSERIPLGSCRLARSDTGLVDPRFQGRLWCGHAAGEK